ncbi:MAG: hypothetical protein P8077_01215 [Gammaproteobacteria bacterium]
MSEPETKIFVSNLGDSSVDFAVRPWVKTEGLVIPELCQAAFFGFLYLGFSYREMNIDCFLMLISQ